MDAAVNFVRNSFTVFSMRILERARRLASGIELQRYRNGASNEGLDTGSAVFRRTTRGQAARRRRLRTTRLARRMSGGRRSLGGIPFKARPVRCAPGYASVRGHWLSVRDSDALRHYALRSGCFNENARGRG